jgi:hypothetical protein
MFEASESLTGIKKKYKNWTENQGKCQISVGDNTHEHILIIYIFLEKKWE